MNFTIVHFWACYKKADYNTKITEIENKMPSISGLATNSAFTAVEDKIPTISSLVKKNRL